MIAGIAFVALASAAMTPPAIRPKVESIVIVRKDQSASIEQAIEAAISGWLHTRLVTTTYQTDALWLNNGDAPFVSPVTNSVTVKARLRVSGEVAQLPIDFDDIVYFDE